MPILTRSPTVPLVCELSIRGVFETYNAMCITRLPWRFVTSVGSCNEIAL